MASEALPEATQGHEQQEITVYATHELMHMWCTTNSTPVKSATKRLIL
jgi:hypothetical protein